MSIVSQKPTSTVDLTISGAKVRLAELSLPGYPLLDDQVAAAARTTPEPALRFPAASCLASGGEPSTTVGLTAAWERLLMATRVLDDLYDRDRPGQLWERVGQARTFNIVGALLALALDQISTASELPPERRVQVLMEISHATIRMAEGEDRDLRGQVRSIDDYWSLVSRTNGVAFSMVCAAGSRCAGADEATVEALRDYGMHLGIAMQIVDDIEGVWWHGPGAGDLERGRVSLPVLYALHTSKPGASEMRGLWSTRAGTGDVQPIRESLDSSGAREFCQFAVREEVTAALSSLATLRDGEGTTVLRSMANSIGV